LNLMFYSATTKLLLLDSLLQEMATDLKRQAMEDFEEATAENEVVRGPLSLNLMLYSAAQTEALCRIGKEVNKEALLEEEVDEAMLADFYNKQVELLGGDEEFFAQVDASLIELKVVESMRDAQRKLYQWRKEFFHDKFKSKYFNPDLPVSNWITLGLDDDHAYNVVPYQITRNFNEVMKLAASKKVLDPNQYEHFYFASDEMASFLASRKFEGDFDEDAEEDLEEVNCGCENDTEEEKWKKEVAGMAMLWHFIAMNCGVSKDEGNM